MEEPLEGRAWWKEVRSLKVWPGRDPGVLVPSFSLCFLVTTGEAESHPNTKQLSCDRVELLNHSRITLMSLRLFCWVFCHWDKTRILTHLMFSSKRRYSFFNFYRLFHRHAVIEHSDLLHPIHISSKPGLERKSFPIVPF